MQLRLTLSLTLNALLLGLVLWLARVETSSEPGGPISRLLTNRVLRLKPRPALPAPAPAPEVVEVSEPFHWAQLESADYRTYIAHLRGIGCPETTVRDILIADVNDLFSVRVKALVDDATGKFWHYLTHTEEFSKLVDTKGEQLRELDHERDELLTALFGKSNPHADEEERANVAARREQWENLADFLPAEKRAQLAAAQEERQRALAEVFRTPGLNGPQQQARRRELETAHEQALRAWLSPEEYDELRLRQSSAASLRDRLVGLDLPEDQVRTAAMIQLTTTDAQTALSQKDADFQARKAQLQQSAEARIKELLGAESYATFQRATDHRYEPIYRVTQRLELSDATAAQAFDIRRQAEEAANRLRNDKALSDEERQAKLQAISAETQQSLTTALGTKAFTAYEKIDGDWMHQMMASKR